MSTGFIGKNLRQSPKTKKLAPKSRTRRRPAETPPSRSVGEESGSPRDRLIQTARRLFYREGLRAVGIDRVLAESGVAKMTLYRHFPSKDDLIVACLAEHERDFWLLWESETACAQSSPGERIYKLIDFIARRTSDPAYQGCIFLNTAQSFPEKTHPAHQFAVEHKQNVFGRLLQLSKDAKARDPVALARQLLLLINGAQATAGMLGKDMQWAIVDAARAMLASQGA
jgi:AcrR family transcriptional regulator